MFKAGLISFLLLSGSALAAEARTVTLGVDNASFPARVLRNGS
jgi:hypothetical protein